MQSMEASVMADRMLSFYFFLFATSIAWWMVRAPSKDVEMKWVEALIRMTIERIERKSPYVRPDFFSCCGVISSGNFSRMAAHFRSGVSKQCNFVRVQCEGAAGSATLGYYVTASRGTLGKMSAWVPPKLFEDRRSEESFGGTRADIFPSGFITL